MRPNQAQPLLHFWLGQVGQQDAVAARVGERRVGAATAAELGVHLDHRAHVHHQHKGRPPFVSGQGAGVALALTAGAQQAIVKAFGVGTRFELLGFQHEVAALVAVDAARAAGAVAVAEADGALEHIVLRGRGVRLGHAQQPAQVDDEGLSRGQLARADSLPALNEGLRRGACRCCACAHLANDSRRQHGARASSIPKTEIDAASRSP